MTKFLARLRYPLMLVKGNSEATSGFGWRYIRSLPAWNEGQCDMDLEIERDKIALMLLDTALPLKSSKTTTP